MSQEALRDAAQMEPFALGQVARPDHQEVGMRGLHLFDDRVDDVVHLHVRLDGEAFFQELIPQCCDQFRGSFEDRSLQFGDLGFGEVSNRQVGHRSLGRAH